MLKHQVLPKPPKKPRVAKEGKKRRFPHASQTKFPALNSQIAEINGNAKSRNAILNSPTIHFIIHLSDSIYWKPIASSIEKLGVNIVSYLGEKEIRVSLRKDLYEQFLDSLEVNSKYIDSIKEIALGTKMDESLLEEIKQKPNDNSLVSIEFSNASGLSEIEIVESAISNWVDKGQYGTVKKSFESDTTLLLLAFLVNKSIETIAEQIYPLSYVAKIPEIMLESEKDQSRIDDELSLELDSTFQLEETNESGNIPSHPVISIDSGINRNHFLLNSNISDTFDYTTGGNTPCDDDFGHGSNVAGLVIYGGDLRQSRLPTTKVIAVKNFDGQQRQIERDIIKVIQESINRYKYTSRILNLSFSARGPNSSQTRALDELVFKEDCIVLASAGNIRKEHIESFLNSGENYPDYITHQGMFFPADCRNVITVGACTEAPSSFVPRDCPSPFTRSNYCRSIIKPDVMAPGGNLEHSNSTGANQVFPVAGLGILTTSNVANRQIEKFGTSMSSPIVANTVSILTQRRFGLSAFLTKAVLISSCTQMVNATDGCIFSNSLQGFGKMNREYAVNSLDWRVCYLLQGEFDTTNQDVIHRYRFLFPDLADTIEVTVVKEK